MSIRVVVVGSGVAGAATAFALAGGGAEVVVVDSVLNGQATAAGAGIVQPWSTSADGPSYDLYAAGAAYYPTLIERLADAGVPDIGYRTETRVGLRPLATHPYLGPLTGSLYVNAGFGAAGLTMAPVAGQALVQLILTGTSTPDLTSFGYPGAPAAR